VPGKYVPVAETVRGFAEIVDGKHDDLPEQAFFMVGGIEEAVAQAKTLSGHAGGQQAAAGAAGDRRVAGRGRRGGGAGRELIMSDELRLQVEVVTPDGSVYVGEASMVIVPGMRRRARLSCRVTSRWSRSSKIGEAPRAAPRRHVGALCHRHRLRPGAVRQWCCWSSTRPSRRAASTWRGPRRPASWAEEAPRLRGDPGAHAEVDFYKAEQALRRAENRLKVAAQA